MLKLLIVDDEQIEREGMQAILEKGFPGIVIKQAKNGMMAMEVTEEFQPDLILMDIKMPGITGLETMEQIIAYHPAVKFIMVTAYDTFEYVRQAIQLGAKDYVLKPSKASEIVVTVGKVLEQIEEERRQQVRRKVQQEALQKTLSLVETDVVTQLLFEHVHEVHLDMLVEMLETPSRDEMFVMLVMLPKGSEHLYSAIKKKIRGTRSGWIGALYGSQLPIIVFRDSDKSYRSQATSLAREILTIANSKADKGWFIGIGSVCSSLDLIRQSYHDALIATMDTGLPVKYRFYSDVPVVGEVCNGDLNKHQKKEFADQIRLGQWEQVRQYMMNMIQCYENERAELLHTQQRVQEVLWVSSRVLSEMGVEIETPMYSFSILDYRQLRVETDLLHERMKQSYFKHYDRKEADTIHQLKRYIIEHSHEDITLDGLAKKVGLSPIYISKMFKEKQGVNYIDFLTECRIEKAKKLMANPEKSIKEITFEVGYHDPNYFSKVFKKMTNVSPKEYRKTLLGNKVY
ncbi:response regulator [Sutcliffiella halmapala]|uniref:response regulator n=1 Tax=Sutcliffiella halmapala TaxID=79882 RepID=UPI0009954EFA|nr:response regulator [Sutcliffiella halmapala]